MVQWSESTSKESNFPSPIIPRVSRKNPGTSSIKSPRPQPSFRAPVNLLSVFINFLGGESYIMVLRIYPWLHAQGSLLEGLRKPYEVPHIKSGLATCKAHALPAALSGPEFALLFFCLCSF